MTFGYQEGNADFSEIVLKSIPIYWISLAFIPNGILKRLRIFSFRFLQTGKREKKGIPLVKWKKIIVSKEMGGWDLKISINLKKHWQQRACRG